MLIVSYKNIYYTLNVCFFYFMVMWHFSYRWLHTYKYILQYLSNK
jgi:hypothetical protein